MTAAVAYVLLFSDCTLETSGLATPAPVDPDFEGCFQVELDTSRRIVLLPRSSAMLSGTARGLFLSGGWSFSGSVASPGVADLSATNEAGGEFDVQATRRGTRPGDIASVSSPPAPADASPWRKRS